MRLFEAFVFISENLEDYPSSQKLSELYIGAAERLGREFEIVKYECLGGPLDGEFLSLPSYQKCVSLVKGWDKPGYNACYALRDDKAVYMEIPEHDPKT